MSSKKRKQANLEGEYSNDSPSVSTKLLSCQRCRARKVKCNFEHPCSSCVKVGAECVQITNDMRKKRPPADYVTKLEKKIEKFNNFFDQYKRLGTADQKCHFIDSVNVESLLSQDLTDEMNDQTNKYDSIEDRAVYGPTSVYDDNIITINSKFSKNEESAINILNKDPDILHCIKLFFTWQYPDHNMFIFRESFLIDFFNPKSNCLYCSEILVLSICALGSKMSENNKIYNRSIQFYKEAKKSLLGSLDQPSITSLQSFLLLAFYDICNGSNSSSWMLSGNAMRMGFDLGFQLHPEVWFLKSKEDLSPLDVAIRSRIYWGSYMADHFISLLLGRPSLLKMSDASIPETDALPDLEWIDDYMYLGKDGKDKKDIAYISNPLKKIINLINISDNMLNDIFTKSDTENDQSNNKELNFESRLDKLYEYNEQITKWRVDLPDDLKWDKKSLKETADNPTLSCIRYFYYILIICLNRPFVGITKTMPEANHHLSPSVICSNAIEDLYEAIHRFKSVHGLKRVSIFIVYSSILSISVMLLSNTSQSLVNEHKEKLQFFMSVLHGSSKTWKLAEKSYNLIRIKLQGRYDNYHDENIKLMAGEKTRTLEKKVRANNIISAEPSSKYITSQKINPSPQSMAHLSKNNNEALNFAYIDRSDASNSNILQSSFEGSNDRANTQPNLVNKSIAESNTELLFDENLDFFGGPPVLMTSDLFNEDWESFFPDYIFNAKN